MPVKSFADIDRMIQNWKNSKNSNTQNKSVYCNASEGTYNYNDNMSSSVPSNNHSMSRNIRIIGVRDVLDGNGYYNSSRQLLK